MSTIGIMDSDEDEQEGGTSKEELHNFLTKVDEIGEIDSEPRSPSPSNLRIYVPLSRLP